MNEQERAEWLAWRRQGIGGSDVSAILGLSRFGSPWTVYLDKTGQAEDREPTEAMWWGSNLEDVIAAKYELDTGYRVTSRQERCERPGFEWMRCTLDGRVVDEAFGGGELSIWEAKYTRDSVEDWGGVVPIEYACQATWNMVVTGTTRCQMAVLHAAFGLKLEVYDLHLDETDADEVVGAASQFWFGHVLRNVPPPADGHELTARAMATVWPEPQGVIEADEEWIAMVQRAKDAKALREAAEREEREACNALRAAIADGSDVVVLDPDTGKRKTIASWRADKNGVRTLRTPGLAS